jgi:hypothetical protein
MHRGSLGRILTFALTLALAPVAALAQPAGSWVTDATGRCKFWWPAPPPASVPYSIQSMKWNGACSNGMASGRGTFEFVKKYQEATPDETWKGEGDFAAGRLTGRGFMGADLGKGNSTRLEGEFRDGVLNGRGIVTYVSRPATITNGTPGGSSRSEAEYRDGKRNGWGVEDAEYTYPGVTVLHHYEGEFRNDKHEGRGIMVDSARGCSRQLRYEGQWKDGHREGPGTQKTFDGRTYTGVFHDGEFGPLTAEYLFATSDDFKQVCR